MTAHLALAQKWSGGQPGLEGQVAQVLLDSLMNNQASALAKLDRLQTSPPNHRFNADFRSWGSQDAEP